MKWLVLARRLSYSRTLRWALGAASLAGAILLGVIAARHLAGGPMPFSHGRPALLVAAGLLFLLAYGFKAYGWRRLFAAGERPQALALAAANGGAAVGGVALPGRFDDAIRLAIVRRYPRCPAGVRAVCLSLVMLGLVDAAALAPLALAGATVAGGGIGVRAALGLVSAAGVLSAVLILTLPRALASRRLVRLRLCRWLTPRSTSLRGASEAWALVSACWFVRGAGVLLLLGALGVGFSIPLALLFLCAGAAAAAIPIGPAGAATQAGAGAAVLIAAGVKTSDALAVAIAAQTLGVLCGAAIVLAAALWRASLQFAPARATA